MRLRGEEAAVLGLRRRGGHRPRAVPGRPPGEIGRIRTVRPLLRRKAFALHPSELTSGKRPGMWRCSHGLHTGEAMLSGRSSARSRARARRCRSAAAARSSARVVDHLEPLRDPAARAADREQHREHLHRHPERLVDQPGVEVDVRVELARRRSSSSSSAICSSSMAMSSSGFLPVTSNTSSHAFLMIFARGS